MRKNEIDRAVQICQNATGNIYDIYFTLYKECIWKQDNPEIVLQKVLIEVPKQGFDEEGDSIYVYDEEVERVKTKYYDLLSVYVSTLVKDNLEESEFYKKLYYGVFESGIFPDDMKIRAILLYLLAEKIPEIPYFQAVNLLKMSNEDYKAGVRRLKPQVDRMIDVLNRNFESRTEEASQIYEIMSHINNREDEIIFLSVYATIIRKDTSSNCT